MLAVGTVVGILTQTVYGVSLRVTDEAGARANAFSFLVFEELFRSFAMRSEVDTFFAIGWRSNLYLLVAVLIPVGIQLAVHHLGVFAELFKVHPISIGECAFFMGLALIPVTILEVRKLVRHRYCKKGDGGPR
jgi:Ca2+-transporting ATPase